MLLVAMKTQADFLFSVRSYECGPDGVASLATVCNYLQEAASLHAERLGFSRSDFAAAGTNISWVLSRLRVKMSRYPRWEEPVTVTTFPRCGRRITALRDFVLRVGEERIGVATSEWMVIDLAARKAVPVPEHVFALADDEHPPVIGGAAFSRLRWSCAGTPDALSLTARRGDIDLNGHVNNVHYVEWLLESLPADHAPIADFEVIFRSETLAGDRVLVESAEVEPNVYAAHAGSPEGKDHVVARFGLAAGRPCR